MMPHLLNLGCTLRERVLFDGAAFQEQTVENIKRPCMTGQNFAQSAGLRNARTQLRIPALQFLEMDARLFPSRAGTAVDKNKDLKPERLKSPMWVE
jgi:hypothetical protein